ncbi:MAG: DsbC family protein [Gammaproteobacteria bacterium]|nr:DsbC family protein [Gammaproteobacteria bacterium]
MFKRITLFILLVMVSVFSVTADEKSDVAAIQKVFAKVLPGAKTDSIKPSALIGLYEVVYGAQVLYMSGDGRYVIQGDLIDLSDRTNLTEATRSVQRASLVQNIKDETSIIFSPEKVKHTITVFTDIDCGYCRKLHREMDQYLAKGIKVRYLAFPRSGVDTKSYHKAVTVWCSDDQQAALTAAKSGTKQDTKTCENPIKDHMKLAEQFGVSGTPTIVFNNGEVVPGYVPAERLSRMLENVKQASL